MFLIGIKKTEDVKGVCCLKETFVKKNPGKTVFGLPRMNMKLHIRIENANFFGIAQKQKVTRPFCFKN